MKESYLIASTSTFVCVCLKIKQIQSGNYYKTDRFLVGYICIYVSVQYMKFCHHAKFLTPLIGSKSDHVFMV